VLIARPFESSGFLRKATTANSGKLGRTKNVWRPQKRCGRLYMATIRLPKDFKEFFELLNSARVEYLLVGGYAVSLHGYPRSTGDIDIWVRPVVTNAARLVSVLEEFGFSRGSIQPEQFLHPDRVVQFGVPPLRIDLLTSVSGLEFDESYRRRETRRIEQIDVPLISREDLLRNKKASGRPKDLSDLQNL